MTRLPSSLPSREALIRWQTRAWRAAMNFCRRLVSVGPGLSQNGLHRLPTGVFARRARELLSLSQAPLPRGQQRDESLLPSCRRVRVSPSPRGRLSGFMVSRFTRQQQRKHDSWSLVPLLTPAEDTTSATVGLCRCMTRPWLLRSALEGYIEPTKPSKLGA